MDLLCAAAPYCTALYAFENSGRPSGGRDALDDLREAVETRARQGRRRSAGRRGQTRAQRNHTRELRSRRRGRRGRQWRQRDARAVLRAAARRRERTRTHIAVVVVVIIVAAVAADAVSPILVSSRASD